MKYILVSIEDDQWNRTIFPKIVAALQKFKVRHVQIVEFHGKVLKEGQLNAEVGK